MKRQNKELVGLMIPLDPKAPTGLFRYKKSELGDHINLFANEDQIFSFLCGRELPHVAEDCPIRPDGNHRPLTNLETKELIEAIHNCFLVWLPLKRARALMKSTR
jgi:hypothetical protein